MQYDVFNGDADGILALLQWRKAYPADSVLITGVKRDISLLQQVGDDACQVMALDIAMSKNREALDALLAAGVRVIYADHHQSGPVPGHPGLTAWIDTAADCCTSLIISRQLQHRYLDWAICAAFGDNLIQVARQLAQQQGWSADQMHRGQRLGELINYNAYGRTVEDLHLPPATLYRQLQQYETPWQVIDDPASPFALLEQAWQQDMARAGQAELLHEDAHICVLRLPDAAWARRIIGVWANKLANDAPHRAHAILSANADGSYTVSIRAPKNNPQGAADVAASFATGGGRAAAAGINRFAIDQLPALIARLRQQYGC